MNPFKMFFQPPQALETPIFRVQPHFPTSDYWTIEYSNDGRRWNRLPRAQTFFRRKRMDYVLCWSEKEAIDLAQSLKEGDALAEWVQREEEKLATAIEQQQTEINRKVARTATII